MKWLKIVKSSATNITYQSDTGTTLNAQPNDLLKKNVLLLFNRKDRAKIRELASEYISPKDEYDFLWLGSLYAIYIGVLLLASFFAPVTIHILGTVQPGGILIFPLTFVVLDSVNEIFQYRYARRLTYLNSAIMFFAAGIVFVCIHVINYPPEFHDRIDTYPLFFLVNAFTLPLADQTNNIIFRLLRYRLATCPLWLRSLVSTSTGQLTYTIAWIALFFGTSIDTALLTRIVDNYGFKIVYAACLIPVTYLIVAVYRARKPAIENQPSVVGEV